MSFFAHTHDSQPQPGSKWQPLAVHLQNVAELAKQNAVGVSQSDNRLAGSAWMAGLLHDLGKYRPEFQQMLLGVSVQKQRTYHKQAGAAKSCEFADIPVAFAIAGHHGGLPNKTDVEAAIISGSARNEVRVD